MKTTPFVKRLLRDVYTKDSGQSDYLAQFTCNFVTGQQPYPTSSARYLALFTVAPTSDAGTGGTEVSTSSTGYARVQIAGQLALSASFTTSSTTLTLASTAPAWLTALGTNGSGVNVYDVTNSQQIGTVSSISGTTVTLTAAASHASSGAADTIAFSAFPAASASSGTEPSVTPANVTNASVITFPAATASWGTVVAFGIYDASSSGNLLMWDYIGNFNWLPVAVNAAASCTFTTHAHGYSSGSSIVFTSKYGGTVPTASGSTSFSGILTVSSAATDTFTASSGAVACGTTTSGDLMVRGVVQQSIPSGVTASFAASTLTLNVA